MLKGTIELYYYCGFGKPEKVDINDLIITSNYLGDITEDFFEAYQEVKENYTLQEAQQNQPLYDFSIWINPTKQQLQNQNTHYGLSKDSYLEDFKGFKQLF